MSDTPLVVTEDRGATRIIRLNRPEKKNAFNIGQAVSFRTAARAVYASTRGAGSGACPTR